MMVRKPGVDISQLEWQNALEVIINRLEKFSHVKAYDWHWTQDKSKKYAFEVNDSRAHKLHGGEPRTFRLKWSWDNKSIENNFGGRSPRLYNRLLIFFVCEHICKIFQGKFALVVEDGFSAYDDDSDTQFYDGLNPLYQNIDYDYWPWTSQVKSNLTEETASERKEEIQCYADNEMKPFTIERWLLDELRNPREELLY